MWLLVPSLVVPSWLPGLGNETSSLWEHRHPGPHAHLCQQLLAHRECVPGSPALSHLVFISFLKSLLLWGGCLVPGGHPGPTAHSAAW